MAYKRPKLKSWRSGLKKAGSKKSARSKKGKSFIEMLDQEAREQVGIVKQLLYETFLQKAVWWHTPSEGKREGMQAWLYTAMGGKKNIPDFMFMDPRQGFVGMVIEYKKTGTPIFKKNGEPYAAVKDQYDFLIQLQERGWKVHLLEGPENFMNAVKSYYGVI